MPNTPQPLPVERIELPNGYFLMREYLGKGTPYYRVHGPDGRLLDIPLNAEHAKAFAAAMQPRDARALEVVKSSVVALEIADKALYDASIAIPSEDDEAALIYEARADVRTALATARQYINEMKG